MKKLFVLASVMMLTACSVVGPGERGVSVSLGKAGSEVREPGAYLWIPFLYGMTTLNIQIQKNEVETSASSKDMQEITTHLAINWSLTPAKVVDVYKTIGDESDIVNRIIQPAVSEALKAASAKKTAEEILNKRLELKDEIDTMLKDRLTKYGITLNDVSIVNLTFSKEFTDAVERKQIAEQRSKQSIYEAEKAGHDAAAEVNRAKGQAEAQRLLKTSISADLLKLEYLRKWDGKLPSVMTGNGGGAMLFQVNTKE